ncbi:hypothetical protein LTR04_006041 [Oleoguttula sp. CCFEE 6159]|nr:hypothetical protein LTR04_006041 [Oleoguttula sp. CCFEE 6159]
MAMNAGARLARARTALTGNGAAFHRLPCHSLPRQTPPTVRTPATLPRTLSRALPAGTRFASTSTQGVVRDSNALVTRLRNLFLGTSIGLFLTFTYLYVTDTRAGVHQWLVVPSLRWLYADAEEAHEAGTRFLKALHSFGVHPRERGDPDVAGDLRVEVFGHVLDNPIGTSAGIDKNAEIPGPLLALGPAIVEVGGATPYPQEGNPKPRVFRLPSQNALINRYGLNSEGADNVAMRLRQRVREFAYAMGFGIDEEAERKVLDGEAGVPPGSLTSGKLMAVQIAKNKFTPDQDIEAVRRDYVYCVDQLARYADIIVVNVSSPNTPGLRALQDVGPLTKILTGVVDAAKATNRKTKPAVMVKVSPDEDSEDQISGICEAVWKSGVDGVIVGNTTKKRPDPIPKGYAMPSKESALMAEIGGYSGPQMFERTLDLVKRYRKLLDQGLRNPPPSSSPSSSSSPSLSSSQDDLAAEEPRKGVKAPSTGDQLENSLSEKTEASTQRDAQRLKTPSTHQDSAASQPLLRLPARNSFFKSEEGLTQSGPALSASTHIEQGSSPNTSSVSSSPSTSSSSPSPSATSLSSAIGTSSTEQKTIFATGGITNGKQALQILNAGASVAMIYTALIYGGVGTISRIKGEMREEMRGSGDKGKEGRNVAAP